LSDTPLDAGFALASNVSPASVEWVWEGRIPRQAITLLVGNPGVGKSMLSLYLTARLSHGELTGSPGRALLLSAEDPVAEVVVPRLKAAHADLASVAVPPSTPDGGEATFMLPDDLDRIEACVRNACVDLVVIDPLSSYLRSSIDTWRESAVRAVLAPLSRLARRNNVALVVIAHLNKREGGDPLHRIGGSVAYPAEARSVLLLAPDPDAPDDPSRRILAQAKSNFGRLAESRKLVLRTTEHGLTHIEDTGPSDLTASDLLIVEEREPRYKLREAMDYLRAELANGERPVGEIRTGAKDLGISETTLYRAKEHLNLESVKVGFTHWVWRLPPAEDEHEASAA